MRSSITEVLDAEHLLARAASVTPAVPGDEWRSARAPTDKNDEDPTAPDDPRHLTAYQVKEHTPFARVPGQRVVDQLGELTVDVIKPDYVLAPAAKSLDVSPAPLALQIDYYKCYRRHRGVPNGGVSRARSAPPERCGCPSAELEEPRRRAHVIGGP